MCRFLLVLLTFTAALFGQTVGVGTFIHVVADLDKTIHFYRDDLGLELTGAAGPRAFTQNAVVEGLYDAKGSQSRVALLKVPGSPLGLEFVEFKGIEQKSVRPDLQDPGASVLTLIVPDTDSVLSRLKLPRDTALIRDPDGFMIALNQAPMPGAKLALIVGDTGRTMRLYRDLLGFQPQTGKAPGKAFLLANARIQNSEAKVPGTEFEVDFLEFQGVDRHPVKTRIHDPGAGVLRLVVQDVDALLATLKTAGYSVVSAGGEPVTIGANRHFVILQDPNGFFFQIVPAPRAP